MKNKKRTFLSTLIIVVVTFIVVGSFLLLKLGAPLKTYAVAIEAEQEEQQDEKNGEQSVCSTIDNRLEPWL